MNKLTALIKAERSLYKRFKVVDRPRDIDDITACRIESLNSYREYKRTHPRSLKAIATGDLRKPGRPRKGSA